MDWIEVYGGQRSLFSFQANHAILYMNRSKLKQAFLTDSDAELFMYLIQCIRFGS